jgi:hypothetical protein
MGWKNVGPLPVRLCIPAPGRLHDVQTWRADAAFLAGSEFDALAADLDTYRARGWTNSWSPEHLRWRLRRPQAVYHVHASSELVAISTRTTQAGVPVAVLLKFLPRGGRPGPLSPRRLIAAACRTHRAPLAVYAGWNANVAVRGVRPPRRLLPSPLYLILRSLSPGIDQEELALETYEFLDLDAY